MTTIEAVKKLEPKPGDILVFKTDPPFNMTQAHQIKEAVSKLGVHPFACMFIGRDDDIEVLSTEHLSKLGYEKIEK